MRCSHEPVSWLTLERYHLMDLGASETRRIADHLKDCPACAACYRAIETDTRALPPLPEVALPRPWRLWPRSRMVLGLAALLAALLVLALLFPEVLERRRTPPSDRLVYKGGELALTVVRERQGAISENPDRYLEGDRFRLFVTVPGTDAVAYDVVVFQDGEVHFPYSAPELIGPGNRIPIPGAFRLTGNALTEICLFSGREIPSRVEIKAHHKEALPPDSVCHVLRASKKVDK
jgi:hypothetical protein